MKKILGFMFIVLSSLLLVSCTENETNGGSTEDPVELTPEITIANTEISLVLGSSYSVDNLDIEVKNADEDKKQVTYSDYDEKIVKIVDNTIYAEGIGATIIKVSLNEYPEVTPQEVKITITDLEGFGINGKTSLIVGETASYDVTPSNLDITLASTDEEVIVIEDGVVKALKEGSAKLIAGYKGSTRELEITVSKDNVLPIITSTVSDSITISWNEDINIFEGLVATDNIDGELELTLKEDFNNQKMGEQEVTYVATDSSGNQATLTRKVNIIWDYSVEFIGHAGSFYGIMNTEEAFLYAVEVLQYQLLECDLKQTQDGVFVLAHDDKFGDYTIANTKWNVLQNATETKTRNSGYPAQNGSVQNGGVYTSKICTLERYLEICKEYGVKAVIELKYSQGINNNDQSRMQALMDEIEKCGMLDNVIFLASQYNCLIWTRNNGYEDIPCQYLVNSCESEEVLNRCIDNDLDLSFNATGNYSNSVEWLQKYKDAGCELSCFTFTQYSNYKTLQEWIDKGVDYVTCDWQLMSKVNLPKEK